MAFKGYEFHDLCLMFPQADEQTIADMASDIKENGLNEPILLYQGKILDGRNRYLACRLAGVKPTYKEYTGEEPFQFVVSKNLHRRHLNESQRAMIAQAIWRVHKEKGDFKVTQEELHKQFNVSNSTIIQAARIEELGADIVKRKIASGEMTLNKATSIVNRARKATGITEDSRYLSEDEKAELRKSQKEIILCTPRNLTAKEFNQQILSGVFDSKRYRRDVQEIQTILAKMETLPVLFDDAISLVGALEQEKMLLAALDMLSTALLNMEDKLQLHPISYDDVMAAVADMMNQRFKLPEIEKSEKREFVEELKHYYLQCCNMLREDIARLKKTLKKSVPKSK